IPLLFRREIYAMACIAGGLFYYLLRQLGIDGELVTILSILVIFLIRLIAVRYKISLPLFYNSTI
ncbi:MAG TPA: trimeric intracellular cation channel family protein, partial [Chitinophagaceae bacterium]|nr:trimeric intracellular cation channel family protein [Chitinophagaceae bacterium]